jgi:hypothetical protein
MFELVLKLTTGVFYTNHYIVTEISDSYPASFERILASSSRPEITGS